MSHDPERLQGALTWLYLQGKSSALSAAGRLIRCDHTHGHDAWTHLGLVGAGGGEMLQGGKAPPVQLVSHLGDLRVQGQPLHLGCCQLSLPLLRLQMLGWLFEAQLLPLSGWA